jgi:light-independent protochlorophyllide reductase subunit B
MQLSLWTYEGPPHIGAMRIASAMRDVHYVLHAPQGDTYADLLFTMIERARRRPPVSYTTFQARDLGKDTAALFQASAKAAVDRFQPKALMVGASCTAELIQDDPGGLAEALDLPIPVIPLELPAYQKKENWGAAETFYQLVRRLCPARTEPLPEAKSPLSCNVLGPTGLGFRHRDDLHAVVELLEAIGLEIQVVAPWDAKVEDLTHLSQAAFNVVLYPEVAGLAAGYLKRQFGQPFTQTIPIGAKGTEAFIREVAGLAGLDPEDCVRRALAAQPCRAPWYSASVDAAYLTGKRVFIFGDATHAIAAARVAREEMGFTVVGLGTYSREFAREVRAAAADHGLEALVTDDYLIVEQAITQASPDLVLGSQMERHIAKRLGLPCTVISAPVHVQDFPARRSPQMGFEGANVLFDTWVHPLMMGLEEHLLAMFKEDFEFHEQAGASHLPASSKPPASDPISFDSPLWTQDAEQALKKIPFFVRKKARANTERFAQDRNLSSITLDVLYEAKAHYAR